MANNKDFILDNPVEVGGSTKGSIRQITASDISVSGYNLSEVVYDNVSFAVNLQDATPYSIQFKPDGTKFYLLGNSSGGKVNQYSLSTAWDLSTASYDNTYYTTGFTTNTCFAIKPDGTKMYIQDYANQTVYQYSLSTAWDVSTASSDSVSFVTTGESAGEMRFKPDGTRFYLITNGTDSITQYSLSTAWDLSTASKDSATLDVSNEETGPIGMAFNDDGTLVFVTGFTGSKIYQYTLSTAWDISTASYDNISFDTTSQNASMSSLFFSSDGTKLYAASFISDSIFQYSSGISAVNFDLSDNNYLTHDLESSVEYTFSNAGDVQMFQLEVTSPEPEAYADLTYWSYDTKSVNNLNNQDAAPWGIGFKSDGTKMFVVGSSNDVVYEYDLSVAWDVSKAIYNGASYSLSTEIGAPRGLFFKPDGTKMYIASDDPWVVAEYDISTAWDITTASHNQSLTISQVSSPEGIHFKPDGTKLFIVDSTSNDVSQYNLSTAWDVSTASFLIEFHIGAQETGARGLAFNSDGTKMYVSGITTSVSIHEYTLSTAWSVFSASYNTNFSVSSQTTTPLGVTFKSDGTKLYIVGDDALDYVYQYSTSFSTNIEITWPNSVTWLGSEPNFVSSGKTDLFTFITTDGGTSYYGRQSGDNFS